MKPRAFDPLALDVSAFARAGAVLRGHCALGELARLAAAEWPGADAAAPVRWSAQGEWRAPRVGAGAPWLHLVAEATLTLECQRCLQPLREALRVERSFRFVAGEEDAAREDEESEEDVLAITRRLNLHELAEDELILALPIVPRHESCPAGGAVAPPEVALPEPEPEAGAPNPFAVLARLRTGK